MRAPLHPFSLMKQRSIIMIIFFLKLNLILYFGSSDIISSTSSSSSSSSYNPLPLQTLELELQLDGYLSFENNDLAATDFGNRYHLHPLAVLHPKSVSDISTTINHIFRMGFASDLTVAARGHGHSIQGQAQAYNGLVINMESFQGSEMKIYTDDDDDDDDDCDENSNDDVDDDNDYEGKIREKGYYVDVSAGELWINILHETLKNGLAPKSWTDYLHLTVGGTLSNAGISGQAFRHGPQISNVNQLQVVTGKGEVVTCSENQNAELFHAVLGGLGQFGIITRARISLEKAPKMVKWIRVLYSDFSKFTNDQEQLISSNDQFDYIEGFVFINRTGLLNNWRSSFNPKEPLQATKFISDGKILYCLEMAKYFTPNDQIHFINMRVDMVLSRLSYIPSTLFTSEVSYLDFLDRVHVSEKQLRAKGLWEIPHPWLNLLIPRTQIHEFAAQVFGNILKDTSNGPIIIYPLNKSKWNNKTSLVTPEEDVFYLVAFLSSAMPYSTGTDGLEHILEQNERILDYCLENLSGVKQYLPHYTTQEEWKAHFGPKWQTILQRKSVYDPLAILAPGQMIFQKGIIPFS